MSKGRVSAKVKAAHKAHKKANKEVTTRYVSTLHKNSGSSGTLVDFNDKHKFMAKTKGGKPNPEYVALVKLSEKKAKAKKKASAAAKAAPKKAGRRVK